MDSGGFPAGEVIIALTALAGVLIAALTAQWRLRAQLRHDRELKDLENLRETFDEASAAVAEARNALNWAIASNESAIAPLGLKLDGGLGTNATIEAGEKAVKVRQMYERIVLRLPDEAAAAEHYLKAHQALDEATGILLLSAGRPLKAPDVDAARKGWEASVTASGEFSRAARALVESRLPEPRSTRRRGLARVFDRLAREP